MQLRIAERARSNILAAASWSTVYLLVDSGQLPHTRVVNSIRISRFHLAELLRNR